MTGILVTNNIGLREGLLDHTGTDLGTRTVSGAAEEEAENLDRIGGWKITDWNVKVSKLILAPIQEAHPPFASSKRILAVR